MIFKDRMSRRTMLKGLGTAIALPYLEAMMPPLAFGGAGEKAAPPVRMAFIYVPNGKHMPDWTPTAAGPDYPMPAILEPLQPFQKDFCVLTGLAQNNARALGDGPGDHARAMSTFLTGTHIKKTSGADIRAGISVDQVAAQKIGIQTRFPSLEIGCERGLQSGSCDSGYSCAYQSNLSWKSETLPMGKEVDPRLLFDRLFSSHIPGETDESRQRRERYKRSILDFVAEDAQALKGKLGSTDQRKLDEYLSGIRELERRLTRTDPGRVGDANPLHRPSGIPKEYEQQVRLMGDLFVLAFQGDLTRISTFVFANDGSNRSYKFMGVPEGHHDLSHHQGNKDKQEKIKKINQFHITQVAYLLGKLKAVNEGSGTLLDNSMIVYGSCIGDGNRHNHNDLPILLLGKGGGTFKTGRHIIYPKDTPLSNLYMSMLELMGAPVESFGDSSGTLNDLT
ncbi:MAG TPA: DUF1552 domain-containing protein [Gemmataceae bacterium]|nr:DUF1552 domain-containing protein [Gemmataceae bacterium]